MRVARRHFLHLAAGAAMLPAMPHIARSADFRKVLAEEVEKWGKVVKFSGAKPG